ncbi:MAG TPA: NAD-dependent epimerase/dehydratase [Armatimonadota bacterium]|jgi:nucleoside-diphosphate-sugar epimerase
METNSTVLVTGGAGYVGSVLVPKLLAAGHAVKVLDLFLYGHAPLGAVAAHPRFTAIAGDLRDEQLLAQILPGCQAVVHLAAISNDPSFDLDPELGKSVNYDSFRPLVRLARDSGVERFIFASSSSVYGPKEEAEVTEDLPLNPLTGYSRYKAICEEELLAERQPGFTTVSIRPATVCGYSPRLRLDVVVNILTNQAYHRRQITVLGGEQKRPNIHVEDIADVYVQMLQYPAAAIDGRVFNAGMRNHTVLEIAHIVREVVGPDVEIEVTPYEDRRSYHISSETLRRELGWEAQRSLEDAVRGLLAAFDAGLVPEALTDPKFFNVETMRARPLS